MANAREVKDFKCSDSFLEAGQQILSTRLQEVCDRRAAVTKPADSVELHDLRIASKRLRYSLEMFAVCFPADEAQQCADGVRAMQDILGRIHDLDVMTDLLIDAAAQIDSRRREEALLLVSNDEEPSERHERLRELFRDAQALRGAAALFGVIGSKRDERRILYHRFEDLWNEWRDTGFLDRLAKAVSTLGSEG